MNRYIHKRTVWLCVWCALLLVGCADRPELSLRQGAGQVFDLSVSIDQGVSKAPLTGTVFANGTHQFGLAVTKADGLTAYESGSGHTWAQAVVSGASQTWTYKWGSMSAAGGVLPLVYGGDPMQVAGYYPYNVGASALAGRDGGRLNVPFDLSTTVEQANQTDLLFSGVQTVSYASGARQSVALSFRHVYALLEFQIKLKTAIQPATITKVEVCNKSGKSFLSNKGFFSPYTGVLTALTAGTVSLTTSTALNGSTYATIRVLVPPTLLAGYADGDIYVQMYDGGVADPKQFPILKGYLTQSGTYGLVGGGKYSFKLLYDNMGLGSLTVVGWQASTADDVLGGGDISGILPLAGWGNTTLADEKFGNGAFVEIGGLRWATGNLVATGPHSCAIGAPTDGGVYFQFGSLIGYKGGAPANGGTGVGMPTDDETAWGGAAAWSWDNDAMVYPSALVGNPTAWPQPTTGTAHKWYFSGDGVTSGEINATDIPNGVGDPCAYYLGAPWRLPTSAEWVALAGAAANQGPWVALPVRGRWFGVDPGAASTSVFIPAAAFRRSSGRISQLNTSGFGASSTVYNGLNGRFFYFNSGVMPAHWDTRMFGMTVRCVQPGATVPHPPAESDYVTIGGLKWAKGNLVAVNETNCKVGAPTDYGVYFMFGSLVGWAGGATGDGVGTGVSRGPTVQVKPATYGGSEEWKTVGRYTDEGTAGTGDCLPKADAPTTGIGDPCRYYLGALWRTPTAAEWLTLIGTDGANTNKALPLRINGYDLSFIAAGCREGDYGESSLLLGEYGYYGSASIAADGDLRTLMFYNGDAFINDMYKRKELATPLRCVQLM